MRAVIDTNVIVSGLIYPSHPPGEIIDMIFSRQVVPVFDDRIFNEYASVLKRPRFSFPANLVDEFLDSILVLGIRVLPQHLLLSLPDDADRCFIECAMAGGKVIITGNKKHFPAQALQAITVLSPAEFLDLPNVRLP